MYKQQNTTNRSKSHCIYFSYDVTGNVTNNVTEDVTSDVTLGMTNPPSSNSGITPCESGKYRKGRTSLVTHDVTKNVTSDVTLDVTEKEEKKKRKKKFPLHPLKKKKNKKRRKTPSHIRACAKKPEKIFANVTNSLEQRRQQFLNSRKPYPNRYGREMIHVSKTPQKRVLRALYLHFGKQTLIFALYNQANAKGEQTMKKTLSILTFMLMTSIANAQIVLSCPDENHPHAIDLGLPSGTKWACCNVGAQRPEESGGFYAWGETANKNDFSWATYIHCDGSYDTCHDLGTDIAGMSYDVAHERWGDKWQMPSSEQINELIKNCTSKWKTLNSLKGRYFTGPNGNTIFLPAAGYQWGGNLYRINGNGYYWSSSQGPSQSDYAYLLNVSSKNSLLDEYYRYYGHMIRPVWSGE